MFNNRVNPVEVKQQEINQLNEQIHQLMAYQHNLSQELQQSKATEETGAPMSDDELRDNLECYELHLTGAEAVKHQLRSPLTRDAFIKHGRLELYCKLVDIQNMNVLVVQAHIAYIRLCIYQNATATTETDRANLIQSAIEDIDTNPLEDWRCTRFFGPVLD